MTHTGIEAFLAIARCKSITKAAEVLCICQSSISIRLQNLEKELGEELFVRQKGHREITLTPMGEEFYPLALQYEKLIEQINTLCTVHRKRLSVSALNSIGAYLLPVSCEKFMQKYPDVELNIQDFEVEAACKSILQGQTDIAFNTESANSDKIVTTPVFCEPMQFICSLDSGYGQVVVLEELSVKNEVFVDWFVGFSEWHGKCFGDDAFPQIRVNIMSQLKLFAEKKNNWAIVPRSVAKGLCEGSKLRICETDFELPKRQINCLYAKDRKQNVYASSFMDCLNEVLSDLEASEK
ncbi:MAG: LysR family transcriptional regulator [Clostridia bacterium]|nr:LysR family transcriptional regulator [Clostridia bacterium]